MENKRRNDDEAVENDESGWRRKKTQEKEDQKEDQKKDQKKEKTKKKEKYKKKILNIFLF